MVLSQTLVNYTVDAFLQSHNGIKGLTIDAILTNGEYINKFKWVE